MASISRAYPIVRAFSRHSSRLSSRSFTTQVISTTRPSESSLFGGQTASRALNSLSHNSSKVSGLQTSPRRVPSCSFATSAKRDVEKIEMEIDGVKVMVPEGTDPSLVVEYSQIPKPRDGFNTPEEILTAFGRESQTKLKVETWDELWTLNGKKMAKLGVGVKERKYILWCMEKFRQGEHPSKFAKPVRPKKKVRGWGPQIKKKKGVPAGLPKKATAAQ